MTVFLMVLAVGGCGESAADQAEEAWRAENRRIDEEKKAQREAARPTLPQDAPLKDWPAIPQPTSRPIYGVGPNLPPLPPLYTERGFDPSLRLEYVLVNSPSEAVRNEFEPKVRSGEIIVIQPSATGTAATFSTVFGKDVHRTRRVLEPEKLYPAFGVGSEKLVAMQTVEDAVFMMLAVIHEHHHYTQWREGNAAQRASFHNVPDGVLLSEEQCRQVWVFEEDAYRVTCDSSVSWGYDMYDGLCDGMLDESYFRQRLFGMMSSGQGRDRPECLVAWAELAGHPHPEAYLK